MINLSELDKLEKYLQDNNYEFIRDGAEPDKVGRFDRHQIRVFRNHYTEQFLSVICHYGSYGYEEGLLEIMGDILPSSDPVGFLTADNVIERMEKHDR